MCMYMHYYWHYEHVAGADEAKRNDGLLAERVAPFRSKTGKSIFDLQNFVWMKRTSSSAVHLKAAVGVRIAALRGCTDAEWRWGAPKSSRSSSS